MTYRDSRFIRELGVTIPEDLEPVNWSIYYFCAPSGLQWSMAVRTAIRMLSRGRFWGRDDRAGSIKAAQRIGRLIEMSVGMCNMSELAEAIKYFADRYQPTQVSQTVNCGCGGGGGGGTSVLDEPDTQDEGEPVDIVPPPVSVDNGGMTTQERCSVATYLADTWVQNFVDIKDTWAGVAVTVSTVTTWLQEKFPPGSIIPFVAMIISTLAVALEAALLANLADNMADAASAQHDDLICAVVNSKSPAEAKQNFESVIADTRATYGKITYTVMILVAQMLDWNKIMGGEVTVPSSYDDADCTACITPEGAVSLLPNSGTWQTLNGGTFEYLGVGLVRVSGTAVNQGAVFQPDTTDLGYIWNKDNGSYSLGYEITSQEKTGANAGALWIQNGTGVCHGTLTAVNVGGEYRGGVPSLASWIAQADAEIPHVGFVSRPGFRLVMASGSGTFSYILKIRLLTGPGAAV